MSVSVVTWRWGRLFGPEYVNRLRSMVARHLHIPHAFFCITDDATGLDPSVQVVPMPRLFEDDRRQASAEFRCRRRLWQFDRARAEVFGQRILHLDLDTVIVDDITPIVDRPEPIVCWRVHYAHCYSGAFMLFTAGALQGLWDAYRLDPEGYPRRTGQRGASDLAMLNFYLLTPPASWDEQDGFVAYFGTGYERVEHLGVGPNRPTLPEGARVVMLGAADKAVLDEGRFAWCREHWR